MTINLSQHAGGGNTKYYPSMLTFDGATSYYYLERASSATALGIVLRVNVAPFTGASDIRPYDIRQGTGTTFQLLIRFYASDHADSELANKCHIICRNAANSTIVSLLTDVNICDSTDHLIVFTYENAGNAQLYVNGVNADDIGFSSRVLTADTLVTYVSGTGKYAIGGDTGGGSLLEGNIGYVGLIEAYITDPAIFGTDTAPTLIDEITWDEWGAQPLLWNEYGQMEDNKGSLANMTLNGTVEPALMNTYIFPHLGLNTIGDAVAADIAPGKIAWVDGVEIVGSGLRNIYDTFTDSNGVLISAHNSDFDTSGAAWENFLATDAEISIDTNQLYASHTVVYPAYPAAIAYKDLGFSDGYFECSHVPGNAGTNGGIVFRYVDEANYWLAYYYALDGTIAIREVVSGSPTDRVTGTGSFSASTPIHISVRAIGTDIIATFDKVDILHWATAATGLSATKHGIQLRRQYDRADDFRAMEIT